MIEPKKIIIVSGKRKSGKDYFSDLLSSKIGFEHCDIIRLSSPLKEQYAKIHNLDFTRLLDSSSYKEKYRDDMIKWGESERNKDSEVFCRLATQIASKPIWIVTDARRPSDIEYFQKYYREKTILLRISCSDTTRINRGWKFVSGIDDAPSECALDGIEWDFVVHNDDNNNDTNVHAISNKIQKLLHVLL
uniref:phosphomevalonate kinase-like n=1 Tax=Styela clava TaxID=7725 RepID=UPI00193A7467|nr:phosphomevalonate kinase-like [Styela clava]